MLNIWWKIECGLHHNFIWWLIGAGKILINAISQSPSFLPSQGNRSFDQKNLETENKYQKSENRNKKSENRNKKSENRNQILINAISQSPSFLPSQGNRSFDQKNLETENKYQKSENRNKKSENRNKKSENRNQILINAISQSPSVLPSQGNRSFDHKKLFDLKYLW